MDYWYAEVFDRGSGPLNAKVPVLTIYICLGVSCFETFNSHNGQWIHCL